jgi:hypothetical protein
VQMVLSGKGKCQVSCGNPLVCLRSTIANAPAEHSPPPPTSDTTDGATATIEVLFQFTAAVKQPRADSVAQIVMVYSATNDAPQRAWGALLDTSEEISGGLIVDAHCFQKCASRMLATCRLATQQVLSYCSAVGCKCACHWRANVCGRQV